MIACKEIFVGPMKLVMALLSHFPVLRMVLVSSQILVIVKWTAMIYQIVEQINFVRIWPLVLPLYEL